MRLTWLAILCFGSASLMLAQRPGVIPPSSPPQSSLGGYGNVLYPGAGHPPPPANTFPGRLGSVVAGRPVYPAAPPRVSHPAHSRTVIVPYPVYLGGYYGYAPDAYQVQPQPDQPYSDAYGAPSVMVNPGYTPDHAAPVLREYSAPPPPDSDVMRMYQTPPTHPYADRPPQPDVPPTIYLLAFKDHNIVPALGYWTEGSTLHYVSVEHSLNQASLDLIDRSLSQRLNDERGVEFRLPAQQ